MNKAQEYKDYILTHINNVIKGFNLYGDLLCNELDIDYQMLKDQVRQHDESKWQPEEFELYRQKFYPMDNEEKISEYEFNKAWLHHIQNNPHHPEHWIFYDHENGKVSVYNIPDNYIAEMLLDWIGMSFAKGGTAYEYYENNKDKYLFTEKTKIKVEYLLDKIKKYDNK